MHKLIPSVAASLLIAPAALVARSLIGQEPRPQEPSRVTTTVGPIYTVPRGQEHLLPNPPPKPLGPGAVLGISSTGFDVEIQGRRVNITGSTELEDKLGGGTYIWLLRIHDASQPGAPRLMREHHYFEEAMWLLPGQTRMTPHFEDATTLPPGRYKVELIFYSLWPGQDPARIRWGQDFKMTVRSYMNRSKRITIPPLSD